MIRISGQVTDVVTGQGLPAATLSVNNEPVGAADEGGSFEILTDSYDDLITASSVGYNSLTLPAEEVQESSLMQLSLVDSSLTAAVVTAKKKNVTPWLILAGLVVVASTSKKGTGHQVGAIKASNLVPVALLGVGAYLLLKPKAPVYSPYPGTAPTSSPGTVTPGITSILTPGNISSAFDWVKDLFSGSGAENSPSGTYTSYDDTTPDNTGMAGMGATTTVNAGDIIGKTLVAAMRVPVYDQANDSAQPSGYISAGQPVGIVYSYLNPDPSLGRAELWWMFEPLPGNSDIGNDQGFYFAPHNPDYYNFQALSDAGVLTVAQTTALKNGETPSTAETLLKKYLPWVIGGFVAVGIGKAVINKVI
jgi:hypothetical protein